MSNKVQISPTAINTLSEEYAVWAKVFNHEIIWLYLDLCFSLVNLTHSIQTAALGCFSDPASELRKSLGLWMPVRRHPRDGDIFICPHLYGARKSSLWGLCWMIYVSGWHSAPASGKTVVSFRMLEPRPRTRGSNDDGKLCQGRMCPAGLTTTKALSYYHQDSDIDLYNALILAAQSEHCHQGPLELIIDAECKAAL